MHEPAEADALEQLVGEAAGLQDQQPDHGGGRLRQHVGGEHHEPQEPPPADAPVEQQRDPDAQRQLQRDREHGEDQVVLDGALEDRVRQRLPVVLQPDPLQRPEAVPGVQAVVRGDGDRRQHEADEQHERRAEQQRQLQPPPAGGPPADRRHGHRRGGRARPLGDARDVLDHWTDFGTESAEPCPAKKFATASSSA